MRMAVAIATLFGNCVAAAPGDQPWDASLKVVVNHGRSQTIGSATVVPPVQDASGNWHWMAVGCWHQFRGYRGEPITLDCSTSDVVYHNARLLTSDRQSDLSVIAFVPSRACANVPLAPLNTVIRGSSAYTIGYPAGSHRGKPVILTLQTVRGRIQQGHSGGGLFVRGKLAGVASATDAYNGPSSYFADAQQVRRIYATACGILGCKPRPDGGGYDKPPINPNPNPTPAPAPPPIPTQDACQCKERLARIEVKVEALEKQPTPTSYNDKELRLLIQRNTGSIESVKREQELIRKGIDGVATTAKENTLRLQNLTIEIQRLDERIGKVERNFTVVIERKN